MGPLGGTARIKGEHMILTVAAVMTPATVLIFVAFLNQRKKPGLRTPATLCLLSSVFGTSLGWLGIAICRFQAEPCYLDLKLTALGGALILYPICLSGRWFAWWVAAMLKRQPPEPRALFRIAGVAIDVGDIVVWTCIVAYGWYLVGVLSLPSI